ACRSEARRQFLKVAIQLRNTISAGARARSTDLVKLNRSDRFEVRRPYRTKVIPSYFISIIRLPSWVHCNSRPRFALKVVESSTPFQQQRPRPPIIACMLKIACTLKQNSPETPL